MMRPTYVVSLVDALRAERLRSRSHFLSFLQAPTGTAAVCLNCGRTFDSCEEADNPCAGEYATCGTDPVPGALPSSAFDMIARCASHQRGEQIGLPSTYEAASTPAVFSEPSDQGIEGAYALPPMPGFGA